MKRLRAITLLLPLVISCKSTVATEEFSLSAKKTQTVDSCYIFELLYADEERMIASLLSSPSNLVSIPVQGIDGDEAENEYFLMTGRAEKEILNARYKIHNDTVHVVSMTGTGIDKLIKIPLKGIHDVSSWNTVATPYYNGLFLGMNFDVLDNCKYVFAGGEPDKESIICFLDNKDYDFEPYDYIPDDGFNSNAIVKKSVYTGNSKVFANGNRILYVCGEGLFATIIDSSAGDIRNLYDEFPKYSADADGINFVRDQRSSTGMYSYASDKAIYLSPLKSKIINGKYMPDSYKGYPPYYTDRIDVFSWEGEKLYTLRLEFPSSGFIVDEELERLYALSEDPDTGVQMIHEYYLPE